MKNKYNPKIHHRRSIRLKGHDYSQAGLYFLTICCKDMACLFGDVVNRKMVLNDAGKMAENYGNAIFTTTLSSTNNRITAFQITLSTILQNGMTINFLKMKNDIVPHHNFRCMHYDIYLESFKKGK